MDPRPLSTGLQTPPGPKNESTHTHTTKLDYSIHSHSLVTTYFTGQSQ
uniref:Uncharacterized protein n=1 Tax=Anguilla anguilla TaxID=7936 RepID=A0A0E9VSC8_ANGAN